MHTEWCGRVWCGRLSAPEQTGRADLYLKHGTGAVADDLMNEAAKLANLAHSRANSHRRGICAVRLHVISDPDSPHQHLAVANVAERNF